MAFCYISWQTDQYLDAQDRADQVWEAYCDSPDYKIDFATFQQEWAEENDGEVPTEDDFINHGDHYVEAWNERNMEP